MGRKEKLLVKAKRSPQNISFNQLETLAGLYRLPLEPGKGGSSHYVLRLPDGTKNTIRREGNRVKKWYVQEVVEAIETFGDTEQAGGLKIETDLDRRFENEKSRNEGTAEH